MDVSSPLNNVDVSKLSDRDKQELQQFVMNESQKARIQSCTLPLLPEIHCARSMVTRVNHSGAGWSCTAAKNMR